MRATSTGSLSRTWYDMFEINHYIFIVNIFSNHKHCSELKLFGAGCGRGQRATATERCHFVVQTRNAQFRVVPDAYAAAASCQAGQAFVAKA